MNNLQIVERLTEIKEQMLELLEEAKDILPKGMTKEVAIDYWYAHIQIGLIKEHSYVAGPMYTIEDTIAELSKDVE